MGLVIKKGTIKLEDVKNIQVLGTDTDGNMSERYSSDFKGDPGTPASEIVSASFAGNDMVFTKDDTTTFSIQDAKIDLKGADGKDGVDGTGDMNKSTYDPNNKGTNAFDYTNLDNTPTLGTAAAEDVAAFAPALGTDDNYVTAAEKSALHSHSNKTALDNVSGTNTGDITVTDSTEIDFTLTGQQITASIKSASIDESKLDTSVNASLDLADSSVQPTSINTLTNKRNQPRTYSTTSVSTLTPEVDTYNVFVLTAQAEALTIANHSTSTPANGEMLLIEMVCGGTARALTFGTNYVAKAGTDLPTTLTANKRTTMLFIWCADISKYNLLTAGTEA